MAKAVQHRREAAGDIPEVMTKIHGSIWQERDSIWDAANLRVRFDNSENSGYNRSNNHPPMELALGPCSEVS